MLYLITADLPVLLFRRRKWRVLVDAPLQTVYEAPPTIWTSCVLHQLYIFDALEADAEVVMQSIGVVANTEEVLGDFWRLNYGFEGGVVRGGGRESIVPELVDVERSIRDSLAGQR